jgi:hypothetical protein
MSETEELRNRVLAAGFQIRSDNTITRRAAAMLVGRAEKTLRNWASSSVRLKPEPGTARYSLDEVLLHLLGGVDKRRREYRRKEIFPNVPNANLHRAD